MNDVLITPLCRMTDEELVALREGRPFVPSTSLPAFTFRLPERTNQDNPAERPPNVERLASQVTENKSTP